MSNKGLFQECDKEEILVVTEGWYWFLSENNISVNKRNYTKYFGSLFAPLPFLHNKKLYNKTRLIIIYMLNLLAPELFFFKF